MIIDKASRGFTMIELIVVMVIMGIIAAVAVPRLMQSDAAERAAAERLRSTLRYAQRMAVARNRDVCVTVAGTVATGTSVSFAIAAAAGTGVPCTGGALTPLGDTSDPLDMVQPPLSVLSFSPAGIFRFTPSGVLADNAGLAVTTRTIALARNGVNFATMSIQPDNGFVLASAF